MKRDMQKYGATYYSSRNQMKCTLEVYSHIQTFQNLVAATETLISTRSFDEIFKIGPSIRLVSLKVLKYVFSQNYVCMQEVLVKVSKTQKQFF